MSRRRKTSMQAEGAIKWVFCGPAKVLKTRDASGQFIVLQRGEAYSLSAEDYDRLSHEASFKLYVEPPPPPKVQEAEENEFVPAEVPVEAESSVDEEVLSND